MVLSFGTNAAAPPKGIFAVYNILSLNSYKRQLRRKLKKSIGASMWAEVKIE
jgi:hypothetical protein